MVGVRHLHVRLIGVDVVARVRMQFADSDLAPPLRPEADPEVGEVLADPAPLDEADVVAEVVADGEERVLRVQEVVVPDTDPLPAISPPSTPGVAGLREEPVEAERRMNRKFASTPATCCGPSSRRPTAATGRSRRRRNSAGCRGGRAARCSCRRRARPSDLVWIVISADAEAADASGQPAAGRNRNLLARIGQADPPREEQQHLFFRRREARVAEPRLARDVAEVEHPGVLEEELALLREEQGRH